MTFFPIAHCLSGLCGRRPNKQFLLNNAKATALGTL
nr:MAG TPA: hypothetical protein [Caudoviricetes sp.]